MIMGLINYPELGDTADKIEEELDYFSRLVICMLYCTYFSLFYINRRCRVYICLSYVVYPWCLILQLGFQCAINLLGSDIC
jgi:hypothetical protein